MHKTLQALISNGWKMDTKCIEVKIKKSFKVKPWNDSPTFSPLLIAHGIQPHSLCTLSKNLFPTHSSNVSIWHSFCLLGSPKNCVVPIIFFSDCRIYVPALASWKWERVWMKTPPKKSESLWVLSRLPAICILFSSDKETPGSMTSSNPLSWFGLVFHFFIFCGFKE